jgi:uncharacterized protein YlxW (UPF0749 family)
MLRRLTCALTVAAVLLTTTSVQPLAAQDQAANPEELNHRLADTLAQLKSAQDRKNELATENEKLNAKIADLEKQLGEANGRAAKIADDTFRLRSYYAAWQVFMARYPLLLERWKIFIDSDPLAVPTAFPDFTPTGNPLLSE